MFRSSEGLGVQPQLLGQLPVRRTGQHLLYRAVPIYHGSELVPRGVELEAVSMEDGGEGLRLHVFVWNIQPGVTIDYRDGSSRKE